MWNKVKIFLEMIKFEHSIFALPFAYMGALLGSVVIHDSLPSWAQIGWITLAMVGARTAAMGLNRIIDRVIDSKNPRTAGRAIPAGLISAGTAMVFVIISFIAFFWATYNLNPLSMKLLPIAVVFLVFYSYTKRFTWLCHIVLGLTIAMGPMGGWVAVTGEINGISLVLYFTIALWTAGFDVIYACQDAESEKSTGVYSIPSKFGVKAGLIVARIFHILTAIGLLTMFFMTDLSYVYLIGLIIAYLILIYEHRLVSPNDLSKLNAAFFTMNGVLSVVVFTFTFIDLVLAR